MPNQEYTYNSAQRLNKNTFTNGNKHFVGWSSSPDTTAIQVLHDDNEYKNCTYTEGKGVVFDGNNGYQDFWQMAISPPFASGDIYTIDFDAKSETNGTSFLHTYFHGANNYLRVKDTFNSSGYHNHASDGGNAVSVSSTEYQHYTVRFILGDTGDGNVPKYMLFRVFKGVGTVSFKNISVCKIVGGSLDYFDKESVDYLPPQSDPTNLYAIWAAPNVYNYDYTGSVQTFTAPVDGTYRLEVWGASSGSFLRDGKTVSSGLSEGRGGYSSGTINLTKGQNLYVSVGGQGANGVFQGDATGGWNGGGAGAWDHSDDEATAGGGGATSIQTSLIEDGQLKNYASKKDSDVLLVAGGGGSNGYGYIRAVGYSRTYGGLRADGGGASGLSGGSEQDNYIAATPGAQNSGYAFGQGESATHKFLNSELGSGGGGWYGGFAAKDVAHDTYVSGSGGSGHIGSMLTTGQTIAGNQSFTAPSGAAETGHIGNGYARITYIGS